MCEKLRKNNCQKAGKIKIRRETVNATVYHPLLIFILLSQSIRLFLGVLWAIYFGTRAKRSHFFLQKTSDILSLQLCFRV